MNWQRWFFFGPKVNFENFFPVEEKKIQLKQLLEKYSTPVFVIDQEIVANRFYRLAAALENFWGESALAYSFKTNYAVARAKFLGPLGVWAEVVSGTEYTLAKKLGYPGEQIIFNGPVKTDPDLARASRENALIHLDNQSELKRFLALPRSLQKKARLGLRLNSQNPYLSPSRFGLVLEDGSARAAFNLLAQASLRLVSLQMHIGTDIDRPEAYELAAEKLARFCLEVERRQKRPIKFLDMGGGFPASGLPRFGHDGWQPRPIEDYIKVIAQVFKKTLRDAEKKTLLVEPGRYLVDDATIFITRIYDRKESGRQILLSDGTVTMLPLKYYRPQIVKVFSPVFRERTKNPEPTTVYGATCREDDWLFTGELPTAAVGDLLVYYCVGAYNQSMGSDFIFNKPRTVTV